VVACDLVLPLEKALDRRGRGGPYNINSFLSDEYTKFVGVICESTTKDAIASDQRSSLRGCGERGGVRIRICGENQSVYVLIFTPHPSRYARHLLPLEKAFFTLPSISRGTRPMVAPTGCGFVKRDVEDAGSLQARCV